MPIFNLTNGDDIWPNGVSSTGNDEVHGADGNDTIYGGDGADEIYGNQDTDVLNGDAGDDVLSGGDGDDTLTGGAGSDILNGGLGYDTVSYHSAPSGINIALAGNDGFGDTFASIERILFSEFSDTFIAAGFSAGVTLNGYGGNDVLTGSNFADRLYGGDGNDNLAGGLGDDAFYGDAGADAFDGGDGFDTVDYRASAEGVTLGLIPTGMDGDAQGDSYVSIERFLLSNQNDVYFAGATGLQVYAGDGDDGLYGGAGADISFGGDGADFLAGNGGADKLNGDAGDDTLVGDAANDQLTGGAGADSFLYYSNATGADRITDFENGVDHITFGGVAGVDDFSDLVITTGAGGAVITLPDGSSITLTGIAAGSVDASDFVFEP